MVKDGLLVEAGLAAHLFSKPAAGPGYIEHRTGILGEPIGLAPLTRSLFPHKIVPLILPASARLLFIFLRQCLFIFSSCGGRYEAVHPVRSLSELKVRLGKGRRCFAFFHPCLPEEPLVFVHVALLPEVAGSMAEIVNPAGAGQGDSGECKENEVRYGRGGGRRN